MPVVNVGSSNKESYFLTFTDAYTKKETSEYITTNSNVNTAIDIENYAIVALDDKKGIAIDKSLTKTDLAEMGVETAGRSQATKNKKLCIFQNTTPYLYGYNIEDFTYTNVTRSSSMCYTSNSAAIDIGDYALFAGGLKSYPSYYSNNAVEAIKDATVSNPASLSVGLSYPIGVKAGNYALIAGGTENWNQQNGGTPSSVVNAYNSSLTRSIPNAMSSSRVYHSCASIGNYALIAGGTNDGTQYTATVDVYDGSLTRSNASDLSVARIYMGATSVGDYVLFAGGSYKPNRYGRPYDGVDTYNASLTKSIASSLTTGGGMSYATSVGNYALITNHESGEYRTKIEPYEYFDNSLYNMFADQKYILDITIPKYSNYKFTESTEKKTGINEINKSYYNYGPGITGYIKINGNTNLTGNINITS